MEIKNVYGAIAAVQAKLDPIVADAEADVPMKSGGKYSYRYATLPHIWRSIRPLLADAGLAVAYRMDSTPDKDLLVVLQVEHAASSTKHEVAIPLLAFGGTMQGLGGAVTYARRYALHLAFGLAIEGEDKDLSDGSGQKGRQARRTTPQQANVRQSDAPPQSAGARLTAAQMALIDGALGRRCRELEGVSAADISNEIKSRRGWVTLSDCPAHELNQLMGEIKAWEPPTGDEAF